MTTQTAAPIPNPHNPVKGGRDLRPLRSNAAGALYRLAPQLNIDGRGSGSALLPEPDSCHDLAFIGTSATYAPYAGEFPALSARLPHSNPKAGHDQVLKSIEATGNPDAPTSGSGLSEHSSPNEKVRS